MWLNSPWPLVRQPAGEDDLHDDDDVDDDEDDDAGVDNGDLSWPLVRQPAGEDDLDLGMDVALWCYKWTHGWNWDGYGCISGWGEV